MNDRNVIHYLFNIFPEVLPMLDKRLLQAWKDSRIRSLYTFRSAHAAPPLVSAAGSEATVTAIPL